MGTVKQTTLGTRGEVWLELYALQYGLGFSPERSIAVVSPTLDLVTFVPPLPPFQRVSRRLW